jgi:hypothetical protein
MGTRSSTPVRIDPELYEEAATAATVMSRSTTQQIAHWARVGRELEASKDVSMEEIASVLSGARSYDELRNEEQAVVRAFWAERMAAIVSELRLDRLSQAEGRAYVELDEKGEIVRREATGSAAATPGV